jgi:GH15 family glucan-1,4-alpha-glucosidase
MNSARYPPIADDGVIGNLQTVALISTDGAIDSYRSPRFDCPGMFASLLDAVPPGHFALRTESQVGAPR